MNTVFWKYDIFPYCLYDNLIELGDDYFIPEGFDTFKVGRSALLGIIRDDLALPIIDKLRALKEKRRLFETETNAAAKDLIKQIRLSLCWECGEPFGKHTPECQAPYYADKGQAFVDRELKKTVLHQIRGLNKVAGNAPQANLLLEVALVLWKAGGTSPVGPSTENSRWFQEFMDEHKLFPQPV